MAVSAQAGTINTIPSWDGSNGISAFGGTSTGVYGETFTAPAAAITSFTFEVNDLGTELDGVYGQVYAWSGSLTGGSGSQGAVGPALFTSGPISIGASNNFQAVTVNTGSTHLTPGQNYVILLADTGGDSAGAEFGLVGHGTANDGGFNFYNNDYTLGSISANNWDDFGDFGSLAYSAAFAGVPEPATWAMLILGVAMVGFAARRRTAAMALAA